MQNTGFKRSETNRGALINVDNSALASYKKQRELMKNMMDHDGRLKKIEDSIEELKSILITIAGNN